MTHVLRCRAPRRNARWDRDTCNRFVAQIPWPFLVTGILRHSREARDGTFVLACPGCGALHEVQRDLAEERPKVVA